MKSPLRCVFLIAVFAPGVFGSDTGSEAAGAPVESDRPTFTEAPGTLATGMLQFESGFLYRVDRPDGSKVRSISGGSPFVRLGVGRRTEVRFGGDGLRTEIRGAGAEREAVTGASDFSLGMRSTIVSERRFTPALALVAAVSLPVGNLRFTSSGYDPTFKAACAKAVGGGVTLGGNVNWSSLTVEGRRYGQWSASLMGSRKALLGAAAFLEVYRSGAAGPVPASPVFDVGLTRPVSRNVQVDFISGRRLSSAGADWFAGVGVAVRSPGLVFGAGARYPRAAGK